MKNPFPGMNPFLERVWQDVHNSLTVYIRDALHPQLPAGLVARVEAQIRIDVDELAQRQIRPDVHVREGRGGRSTAAGGPAVLDAPTPSDAFVILADEPPVQRHIEILDAGRRVITAIEVLSPTNKISYEDRLQYREKQQCYRAAGVNLVEIDLLRGGAYALAAPLEKIPPSQRMPYMVCVFRAAKPLQWEVYPIALRAPLPAVRIPLRESDADITLDLQPLLNRSYEQGSYGPDDYVLPLDPPLSPEDAAWADGILRAAGLRS